MIYPPLWDAETEARIKAEARNLDPQTTPETIQMCTRCVMTNQRPRIVFDDAGVCSACHYADHQKHEIDWKAREEELIALIHRTKYCAVVPASGGKDSSFVAHRLRHTYGAEVLAARFMPFMITEIGEQNWQAFIHSNFDSVTSQPGGLLHRKLARLSIEFYGDPFQPFTYGQLCWPMHLAKQSGVDLVMFGENGEAVYGGDTAANDKPCWDESDWQRVYHKGAGIDRLINIGRDMGVFSEHEVRGLSWHYSLPEDPLDMGLPEFHWMSYYVPWHPQSNFYYAAENCGFMPNKKRSDGTYSRYASLDDKLDGLHYYMAFIKFGIGRATSDAAHEVRDGDLERDEALALVERYDGEFPKTHLTECLDYLGMDEAHLETVVERFRGTKKTAHRAA